ncbi:hypothetical protein PHISCL_04013 [Aspergillus sclerotialis]|uniref:Carbohydrate kinase FGGY N-terminal domain-containing protein n=1 Tax=Aspergillus sclerotialis TaxID=2070753 RepID=A0A3A2ZQ89_9EURO|nr:hypothetical protein PHISCL_04013 [Aspergillus sclerotialis]
MSSPFRRGSQQSVRRASRDPRDELLVHEDHYIGIDVGTGSARACIIDCKGDIVGLASENIGLWQPQQGYYVNPSLLLAYFPCALTWKEAH